MGSTKSNWISAGNAVGEFLGTTAFGGLDSWVSAFDRDGTNTWSLRLGTAQDEIATAMTVDAKEEIWIAGLAQTEPSAPSAPTPQSTNSAASPQPIETPTIPIPTPSPIQLLNPESVTTPSLVQIRAELKYLTVSKVDKNGVLLNTFATLLDNFGYVSAIISVSSGAYLIGVEAIKNGGERSFMQFVSATGEFGKKYYFGKSATRLTAGVFNKDQSLTLVGQSSETLAKKPLVGKVDGIILTVASASGAITKVVRSNGTAATRSWSSAVGNLTVAGTSKSKNLTEAVISQFSATGSVQWSKRYVGANAALNSATAVAVLSVEPNSILRSKSDDLMVYQVTKNGEPLLGGRIRQMGQILGIRSQAGLGTLVASKGVDGSYSLTQLSF